MKEINVGLIGYKFMGKAHSFAYKNVNLFFDLPLKIVMKVICGRTEKAVKQAKEKFGWIEYETDWRKVVERKDIDLIDITTPPNAHKEIAIETAKNGKIVFCEKPLALTLKDAYQSLKQLKNIKLNMLYVLIIENCLQLDLQKNL